jgi:hypothetical protein
LTLGTKIAWREARKEGALEEQPEPTFHPMKPGGEKEPERSIGTPHDDARWQRLAFMPAVFERSDAHTRARQRWHGGNEAFLQEGDMGLLQDRPVEEGEGVGHGPLRSGVARRRRVTFNSFITLDT